MAVLRRDRDPAAIGLACPFEAGRHSALVDAHELADHGRGDERLERRGVPERRVAKDHFFFAGVISIVGPFVDH